MPHVRPATPADAPFIVECQMRMAMETENLELVRDAVGRGVAAVFADAHKGRYYVAEVGGELAGCLMTIPEWSDWRDGTVLWIHSVYVRPAQRQRGVFGAMYGHLKKMVESDASLRGLRLYVHKDNGRARGIYRGLGMDGEHYQMFEWMKE